MNGHRNHSPEATFITQLKRYPGKRYLGKRYFHCFGTRHSLHLLPKDDHFYTNTRGWSSQSFPPCGWHNLQFGFISSAWESEDTTPRLLLAALLLLLPPCLELLLHKGQAARAGSARRTPCWRHLPAKTNACFKPLVLWNKGVTAQHTSLPFGHCFEMRYAAQYYQPASSDLGQSL